MGVGIVSSSSSLPTSSICCRHVVAPSPPLPLALLSPPSKGFKTLSRMQLVIHEWAMLIGLAELCVHGLIPIVGSSAALHEYAARNRIMVDAENELA
ncbi:hypothetical protein V6N13_149007 [Hibiscus sabdariffa]|uniref:Chlorophyll a-b binding protein, chloroplastic n=2 Tax=Hibiscus sabdariffa TaxID=183260 RepID=A0ABR1ZSP3_9ROSI